MSDLHVSPDVEFHGGCWQGVVDSLPIVSTSPVNILIVLVKDDLQVLLSSALVLDAVVLLASATFLIEYV